MINKLNLVHVLWFDACNTTPSAETHILQKYSVYFEKSDGAPQCLIFETDENRYGHRSDAEHSETNRTESGYGRLSLRRRHKIPIKETTLHDTGKGTLRLERQSKQCRNISEVRKRMETSYKTTLIIRRRASRRSVTTLNVETHIFHYLNVVTAICETVARIGV